MLLFSDAPSSLLRPFCLYHQTAGWSLGDRGCCYSPQESWSDKDVRGDDTSLTPVSSHKRACPTSVSCVLTALGCGQMCDRMTAILWKYHLCGSHFVFIYVSVCLQVKELYQGVLGKLQLLHPRLITEERMGEGYERMRREVEREVVRRKTLGSQLRTLLDSQLQVYITLHSHLYISHYKN